MAKKLIYNYTFTPGGVGAGTIAMRGRWEERTILLITNVTDNIIIYNFAGSGLGGTTTYNSTTDQTTLTLNYNTSSMSSSDELQIFVDQQFDEIEFSDTFTDPVFKLRVSTPENLIDTDFEYGLQSSKWETLELVNNIPSVYSANGGVSIGGISEVASTTGTQLIRVTCTIDHNLSIGNPIEIQGLTSRTANGKYIVTNVETTKIFTYKAAGVQATTGDLKTAYTTIIPAQFYSSSDIIYNINESIATDNANPSTLTFTTDYNHGLSTSTSLYITNTVGKRTYTLTNNSSTAPDGLPYVKAGTATTIDSSFYLPDHKLYQNQRITITVNSPASYPTSVAGAIPPTDASTCQSVYNSTTAALDTIRSTMGTDASRFLMNFTLPNNYPLYTENYSNVTSADSGTATQTDISLQYMVYGDWNQNVPTYFRCFKNNNTGLYTEYIMSGNTGRSTSALAYTGTPVDMGALFNRNTVFGSPVGPANLSGRGMFWCGTPFISNSYSPYIVSIKQFPTSAVLLGDAAGTQTYYFDFSYLSKRLFSNYTGWYTGQQNTRTSIGGGWVYTYYSVYTPPSNPYNGYQSIYINLENTNWTGYTAAFNQFWYGQNPYGVQAFYGQMTEPMGPYYRIEVLLPVDDDVIFNRYGPSGSVLTTAQMVNTIVTQISNDLSYPTFAASTGITTAFASIVNSNRINLRSSNGSKYLFTNTGTGPYTIETDQTSGVLDDFHIVSGLTSTTVSIASSNQVSPRVLTFNSTTGIVSFTNDPHIYVPGGHGLADGQKVVFNVTSGSAPSGISNGQTYYAIVRDSEYLRLASTTANAVTGTNAITNPARPLTTAQYNLTINSIAGRVAAAGTVGITTTSTATVTGYNTKFLSTYKPGDRFIIRGSGTPPTGSGGVAPTFITGEVSSVITDTSLLLTGAPGVTTSNAPHFVDTKINVRADGEFLHRPFDGGVEITAGTSPDSQIVRQTRKYFRYQSGKGIQCSVAINFNPYRPIRLATGAGSAVTMETEYPHGLVAGNTITVRGASDSTYNGTFTVSSVTDFTFSYTAGGSVSVTNPTGFIEYSISSYTNAGVRCGLFDFQNGFFYEYDGTALYAVRRSSVQQLSGTANPIKNSNIVNGTGTRFLDQLSVGDMIVIRGQSYKITRVESQTAIHIQPAYRGSNQSGVVITKTIDTKVAQSSWNIDKCDGTGPSGFNLDITKIQMAYFDYSWYGAGKIRFGFKDTFGKVRYMHEFIHNNRLNEAYMRSGNIPARYEVFNTGIPTFVPSLFHWGTSVIMDGRFDDDDSYLFTASGNSLTFTNGASQTATTTASSSLFTQRGSGGLNNYYVRLSFSTADATKFSTGIPLYTANGQLNGQTVNFTGFGSGVFFVYIFLNTGYTAPVSFPIVASATTVNIGAAAAGTTNIDLNSLIPLISVRLAPSVDNSLIGSLGDRDVVNRMQLKMKELGVSVSHDSTITVVLNGNVSNTTYSNVGSPSLSQYIAHAAGDTIDGGFTIYQFRASGGSQKSAGKRFSNTSTFSLDGLTDLGNSILGGNNVFPNGPDILTICTSVVETSEIDTTSVYQVSSRLSWAESQA